MKLKELRLEIERLQKLGDDITMFDVGKKEAIKQTVEAVTKAFDLSSIVRPKTTGLEWQKIKKLLEIE